jgi:hypothetical protein
VESKEKLDLLIRIAKMYVCMYVVLFVTVITICSNMLMTILPPIKPYGELHTVLPLKKLTFK